MRELDRWGDSAAVALLDEVTSVETEEALAVVRAGGSRGAADRPAWRMLALAAAAIVVLVGGLAAIKSRDTDEIEPPLATPPGSVPLTTNPTVPATTGPTSPASTAPSTAPASTVPDTSAPAVTEPPATTAPPPATIQPPLAVPPLADQPGFGGASKVAYASEGAIIVAGSQGDGSPVLWRWSDAAEAWTSSELPGDNPYVPVAFASDTTGFAFVDGSVQKTADSGETWQPLDIASPSGGAVNVIELAIGADFVHALAVDEDDAMTFRVYTMPIDGDAFTASAVEFPPPAGGEPVASFAFDDVSGWMAVTSRTLIGAAAFSDGQWTEAQDVICVNGGVTFASSGDHGDVVRSCDSGYMGSDGSVPVGTQMEVSSNSGGVFTPIVLPEGGTDNPPFFTLLARPDARTIVISRQGDAGSFVTNNGNNGQGWQPLGLPDGSFVSDLEANSSGMWVAVGSNPDGDQKVWVSRDRGTSWDG